MSPNDELFNAEAFFDGPKAVADPKAPAEDSKAPAEDSKATASLGASSSNS